MLEYIRKKYGCASGSSTGLIFMVILACFCFKGREAGAQNLYEQGGIVRGDTSKRTLSLVFTGHEFAEGGEFIRKELIFLMFLDEIPKA